MSENQETEQQASSSQGSQDNEHVCSFCGKRANSSRLLLAGPNGIFICEDCTKVCVKIFTDARAEMKEQETEKK